MCPQSVRPQSVRPRSLCPLEPAPPEPVPLNKRSRRSEKPKHRNQGTAAARHKQSKARAAVKTQHSHRPT